MTSRILPLLGLALALAQGSPAAAQASGWSQTGADRCLSGPRDQAAACLDREIRNEDAHMERRYARVLQVREEYGSGLREVRRHWAAFQEADCAYRGRTTRDDLDPRLCALEHIEAFVDALNDADFTPDGERDPRDRHPQPVDPHPVSGPPTEYDRCMKRARIGMDEALCIHQEEMRSDAQLNRVYKALMARLSDPADQAALRKAQRAWIGYRDTRCGLEYEGGGTAAPAYSSMCADVETGTRTLQLEGFLRAAARR